MAEALSDDDKTDSIDSVVPAYREEATDDDGDEGDIINSAKKMRASGLSFWECEILNESENWTKSTCPCPACLTYYICKHIICTNYAASHWKLKIFHWDKKEKEVVLLKLKKH
jgi:hypothetical protein